MITNEPSPTRRKLFRVLAVAFLAIIAIHVVTVGVRAAGPRILPAGQLPDDWRLKPLTDLNGYFPFVPSKSPREWAKRSGKVRRRMRVALGLWPMPTKTPLRAVVHGKINRGDYTVEKAYFESFPGFFVTGNLYRPVGKSGKRPGVLCPHGHWSQGRFYDAGEDSVRRQIEQGGEKFAEGGRSPLQSRCVQLARMGCVVFHYDMIGYADSVQLSYQLAHRFAKQRPDMNSATNWGLFSPQAEAHLQSVMGMQAYSSVRALDFLESLPDVDAKRLAVTGASGGGTQTFILAALDKRPVAAVPAVMVSTAMQGGCTCENCCLLRVGTGNVEIAALFSPRPLLLTAANDWTKEMETKGFPELRQHYKMLGVEHDVALMAALQFGHNYNHVGRTAMYHWLNKHLKLGVKEPIEERDYLRLTTDEMSVWDEQHPKPTGGAEFERKLLRWMTADARKQLAGLRPSDAASLRKYRQTIGTAVDVMIGRGLPSPKQLDYHQTDKQDKGDYLEIVGLLRYEPSADRKEELPIAFLHPKDWGRRVVIWIDEQGKNGIYNADGSLTAQTQALLDARVTVIGVDLLHQGEFLKDGKPVTKTRRVGNTREFAGYTFGYNDTLFARRVQDILSTIAFVRSHDLEPDEVDVVGLGGAGPLVVAARALARDAVDRAAVDTGGFRFAGVRDIHDANFLPGGAKYDDLPGMLAVAAPGKLWLAGAGKEIPEAVAAAYKAAGSPESVTVPVAGKATPAAVVEWLLKTEK